MKFSLVLRLLREQEVAGSNPVAPTIYLSGFLGLLDLALASSLLFYGGRYPHSGNDGEYSKAQAGACQWNARHQNATQARRGKGHVVRTRPSTEKPPLRSGLDVSRAASRLAVGSIELQRSS
ncbi:MAG: hypothetical protein ISP90_02125 [Nevskia sp.]|nr:hypothetical protein [Nevskia sp.]